MAQRPSWLPPSVIVLTEAGPNGTGLPVYMEARAVMAVEDVGKDTGSLVHLPARPDPFEVRETPQQVFAAITEATR